MLKAVEFGLLAVTALVLLGLAFMRPVAAKDDTRPEAAKSEKRRAV
jgi:hypothetical protein